MINKVRIIILPVIKKLTKLLNKYFTFKTVSWLLLPFQVLAKINHTLDLLFYSQVK